MISFQETIGLALSSLRTNKTRSFLTMLGIIIGVSSVILLVSIGSGLKDYITSQFEDLGTNTLFIMPGSMGGLASGDESAGVPGAGMATPKFTEKHLRQIKSESEYVTIIMPHIETSGSISYRGEIYLTMLVGTGVQYQEINNHYVTNGSFFTASQEETGKRVLTLGTKVAEELFGDEDPVGKKVTVSDQKFTVLGVHEEKGGFGNTSYDNLAFTPWTTVMNINELENIMSFMVRVRSAEEVPLATEELEQILLKDLDDEDFTVLDTKSMLNTISSILSTLTIALGGIAAISLLVGGIGIMNIMLVSVTERTREIGLRKAVGATPQTILTQFITEAVVFSVIGGGNWYFDRHRWLNDHQPVYPNHRHPLVGSTRFWCFLSYWNYLWRCSSGQSRQARSN
ncbi:ABC transporter permease [Patescibacteria group bacterium]|nr:ABC transporter permease [Patescibacteria group bacterium]